MLHEFGGYPIERYRLVKDTMKIEKLQYIVKERLFNSNDLLTHLGVVEMAKRLANHYGIPVEKAEIAALCTM